MPVCDNLIDRIGQSQLRLTFLRIRVAKVSEHIRSAPRDLILRRLASICHSPISHFWDTWSARKPAACVAAGKPTPPQRAEPLLDLVLDRLGGAQDRARAEE